MLTDLRLEEIREHLNKAQNPIFLYDHDLDGFSSFVLLRRFLGRGKGVAVRSHPDIDPNYAKKVKELDADYVFILDRPFLGERFIKEIESFGVPVVWIDHHYVPEENLNYPNLFRYRSLLKKHEKKEKESGEPVTYLCYQLTKKIEDLWIALMGCISDHYLPDFSSDFSKHYPEWWKKDVREPFDAYYSSEIGKLAQSVSFGLKDSVTHVVYLQNFMIGCKTPEDLRAELDSKSSFARKSREMRQSYEKLLMKARSQENKRRVYFEYGGVMSMSSELANALSYYYPKRKVAVIYLKGVVSNISLRGPGVRDRLEKVLGEFESASGGGHEEAVGARIRSADLERFKELFLENR